MAGSDERWGNNREVLQWVIIGPARTGQAKLSGSSVITDWRKSQVKCHHQNVLTVQGSVIDIKSGVRLRTTLWPESDLSRAIKVPSNKVLARPNKIIKYKAKFPNLSLIYERSVYLEQYLEVLQKQITRSFYQYSKLLNAQFFLGAYIWIYRTNDYNTILWECQERWNK